jgi:adiponectin receptor
MHPTPLLPSTGFILFVCLTVYVVYEPPTPLAFSHLQVNTLWSELNGRMHQLPESLSGGLHHLTEAARGLSPGLQQFQHGISERMHTLQEGLSERLHGLQEGLQERVHQVSEEITERVHDLQEGFQERVHQISETAASQYLYESLAGLLCWPTARWPTFVYMGGAMTCLLLSTVCHLMGCCQKHISQMVWRFDYAGIAVLIVTSFYPVVYYGFLCHKPYLTFYLVSTTMLGEQTRCRGGWKEVLGCAVTLNNLLPAVATSSPHKPDGRSAPHQASEQSWSR